MFGANLPLPDPIELVALDPARNIRRRYSLTASLDLFGMIVVETRWGPLGARGQAPARAFADHSAADRHLAATLTQRDTAESRNGFASRRSDTSSLGQEWGPSSTSPGVPKP